MFNLNTYHFSTAEKLLFFLVILYAQICIGIAYDHEILDRMDFLLYLSSGIFTLATAIGMFVYYCCFKILYWKAIIKPRPLLREWWPKLTKNFLVKQRLTHAIPLYIVIIIFLTLFSNMKGLLPYYGDYIWDQTFVELDRNIHFGIDPWRITQPFLGYPIITAALDVLYALWMFVMFFFLYWQLVSIENPRLRLQFFFTFILTWGISGTLFAMLFASGGPCFYEAMTGNDYFFEQLNYLQKVNEQYELGSLSAQKMLLGLFQQDSIMVGVGISAMPSLHVATAFLFYLLTSKLNKWLGYFFALYCCLIFLGSVHLAWHYAVDGYVSVFLTWIYWKFSGIFIEKTEQANGVFSLFKHALTKRS